MNESLTAIGGRPASASTDEARAVARPAPWGFWSTLGWSVLAFGLAAAVVFGAVVWLNWRQLENMPGLEDDPWFPLQFIATSIVQVAVLTVAARLAGWPAGAYFGLVRPRGRDLAFSLTALLVLMAALEILTHLLGRASVTPFQIDSYRAAKAAGMVPLLWIAFVIAAPASEEIVFRGFVFRGWAASRLGPTGTIVLTSLVFAAAHVQYDWFGVFQTFCIGALLASLRWRTGSTTITILLHMAINFVSTAWSAIKVEGLM